MDYEFGLKLAKDIKEFGKEDFEGAWYLRYILAVALLIFAYSLTFIEPVKTSNVWAIYIGIGGLVIVAAIYAREITKIAFWIGLVVLIFSGLASLPAIPLAIIAGALIIGHAINQRP